MVAARPIANPAADRAALARGRGVDLQIALCAFEGGARELWSRDKRFVTVPGLRLVAALS